MALHEGSLQEMCKRREEWTQEKSLGTSALRKVIEDMLVYLKTFWFIPSQSYQESASWDDKWDNTTHMAYKTWKKKDCIFIFFKTELDQIYSILAHLKRFD